MSRAWTPKSLAGAELSRRQWLNEAASSAPTASLLLSSSSQTIAPTTKLSDGSIFPLACFGLQIYDDSTAYRLTTTALECGYRNFFASVLAGNQKGFARAIRDSSIPRGELYICGSVVSNRVSGFEAAKALTAKGCDDNMKAFAAGNIDYLDQIMLDYPGPNCDSIRGQWAAFQDMQQAGLVKSLSVSNFSPAQLDCILDDPITRSRPVVNQLPYSVGYHKGNTVEANTKRGVLVQAWAPLGGSLGGRFSSSLKAKCGDIGRKYNKSWAQVALRWIVQSGVSFSTQSQIRSHFVEDLNIFDFELSEQDMQVLSELV